MLPRFNVVVTAWRQSCGNRAITSTVAEATFYHMPDPSADDRAFYACLTEQGVAVLSGHVIDLPGYFHISLTATDEMMERSLPSFTHAIQHANSSLRA
jgi:aspartate aminotransferase